MRVLFGNRLSQKRPVPAAVFVKHQVITSPNVELIYPLDKQCEVKVGF
jgi:hypothetical protein